MKKWILTRIAVSFVILAFILFNMSSVYATTPLFCRGYVYNEKNEICTINHQGVCPVKHESLEKCEKTNKIVLPNESIMNACKEKIKDIKSTTYQRDELINSILNECYFDYALVTRNESLCKFISLDKGWSDYKDKCIKEVKLLKARPLVLSECSIKWNVGYTCGEGLILGDQGFVADDIINYGRCIKADGSSRCGLGTCINQSTGDLYNCGLNSKENKNNLSSNNKSSECQSDSGCPYLDHSSPENNGKFFRCINGKCKIQKNCPEGSVDEEGKCNKNLSNGRKAEIKIMPSTAYQRAIERLGELGFNTILKEIGQGENAKAVYELTADKEGKMLGLFKVKGKVSAEVDAETGEIIKIHKPWWVSLISGI